MPEYDETYFEPPAPIARVTLRNPETGATLPDVELLLDSGADVTLLPQASVNLIGMVPIPGKQYELMGFDGNISLAPIVRTEIVFCRRTFRGQFLLTDRAWGVLGRNILNAVPLLLDGPHLRWGEHLGA